MRLDQQYQHCSKQNVPAGVVPNHISQRAKGRRGYSDNRVILTICTLTAIFLPRQGSAELSRYHRTGWLTTMHNPYFSSCPPCCFEFELQCCEDNAVKLAAISGHW